MRQFNFLNKLLEVQPTGSPFISLYLNTEPNETGKKDFDVFLRKQLSDHIAVMDAGSEKREHFEQDSKKIEEFVESLDPSTRGVAIFASAGDGDFFRTYEFEVPFEENHFYLFDRPYIFPLIRLFDQHPTFAVVSADTNSANIYMFRRAKTVRHEEIQNTKTGRSEVGGWSQMRYQRHIENFHQQHAKETIDELTTIVRSGDVDHVILAGDEAVIIPLLRNEMPEELSKKVIGTLKLNVNTSEHEIGEAGRELLAQHLNDANKENVDQLMEVNYENGVGVTGFEDVLSALFNGQVQKLYLSSNPEDIVYRDQDVRVLIKAYEPGLDDDIPDTRERELLIDELIKQAALSADEISFIGGEEGLLKPVGGVGAILRYQAKGATNQ
ncbi:MAG TPA: Vms1/Ankzf1 family peptidyl-tRNA hydrolase [Pyrinomonadaceae bacterium]|nr:Vms1/Ankzf1 family peptidyl-tRNA hydrolase [Pyrinomonadaceae bacterium]